MTSTSAKLENSTTATASPLANTPAAVNAQAPDHDTLARLMQAGVLRPKLKIGGAGDPEERDADCMADRAMGGGGCCDSCAKEASNPDTLRMKPIGSDTAAMRGHASGADSIMGGLGSGEPLNPRLKSLLQPSFGRDLGGVRLHTGTNAQEAASSIGARAFAVSGNIAFGAGQYQPETRDGQRLLAHELAHVTMGHSGIRRIGIADEAVPTPAERRIAREERERKQREHSNWLDSVEKHRQGSLREQSKSLGEERQRLQLAMTSQRGAAIDAVANGAGWLGGALKAQGYSGPPLIEVRAAWAEAVVTAELLNLDVAGGNVSSESRLTALESLPVFYAKVAPFVVAAEQAHRTHADTENARMRTDFEARLAAYDRSVEMDRSNRMSDLGSHAAEGSMALLRGSRPSEPKYLQTPPKISSEVEAASGNVTKADSFEEWRAVAEDVKRLGNGFATIVSASLPASDDNAAGMKYLEELDERLAKFEGEHQISFRIPATFYPLDRTINQTGEDGKPLTAPESIPWQFYLINTGVSSYDRPATSGGEWVLVDLTSGQRFENRMAASDLDSAKLQQGALVDPPIDMFTDLNSRIRFPSGRLHFQLPTGKTYVLETTEPWSLSDFFTAIGMTLAAIAIIAGVIASGGAALPAAIAGYATLGAGAFGIAATLAGLHEKSEQGGLTDTDINEAYVSIAIDLVSMVTFGFGKLVGNAAKLGITGERLILLQSAAKASKIVSLGTNVYQALTVTVGLLRALQAIDNQPGLTPEERRRRKGEIVRHGLLAGALLFVAIRGDIKELKAGTTLNISHVDPEGVLVPHEKAPHVEGEPHANAEAPAGVTGAGALHSTHAEVSPGVHAHANDAGTGIKVGPQTHAVGVAGRGRTHDFYFCSDLCTSLRSKFEAVLGALPENHPEREIFQELHKKARVAAEKLRTGKITQEQADAIAKQLSEDIARHSGQSPLFAALMNTNIEDLMKHRLAIRARLDQDASHLALESQAERQKANRGVNRANDPTGEPQQASPLETDLLGGVSIQGVNRPSKRPQALHFDTGNFSHMNAEALVPGLPRGLTPEVPVTLPDGTAGRADRVRFIYDADGDVIGAHVYEIKPDTPRQRAQGEVQRQGYQDGLKARIEADLRANNKAIPERAPDGGPLYGGEVMTYDRERMRAVLRALRANRRDYGLRVSNQEVATRQAADEAIARETFGPP